MSRSAVALTLLCLAGCAQSATAPRPRLAPAPATYSVAPGAAAHVGCTAAAPCSAVMDAVAVIQAANRPATIWLNGGRYPEQVVIQSGPQITLQGDPKAHVEVHPTTCPTATSPAALVVYDNTAVVVNNVLFIDDCAASPAPRYDVLVQQAHLTIGPGACFGSGSAPLAALVELEETAYFEFYRGLCVPGNAAEVFSINALSTAEGDPGGSGGITGGGHVQLFAALNGPGATFEVFWPLFDGADISVDGPSYAMLNSAFLFGADTADPMPDGVQTKLGGLVACGGRGYVTSC